MRGMVMWIIALAFVPALWGQDTPKDKAPEKKPATAEQYKALMDELRKNQQRFGKAHEAAQTEEEQDKIEKEFNKVVQTFVGRFLELAAKNPKDKLAVEALIFVVVNAADGPEGDKAVELLLKNHFDKLAGVLSSLSEVPSPGVGKLIRGFLDKSTDPKDQGGATFIFAKYFKNRSESPDLKPGEPEKLSKEAEDLFAKVVDKYGKIDELAKEAKEGLAELRLLGIGKIAPEIEGEDIDGKKFKLSDYRGKVVVLDFWGNW